MGLFGICEKKKSTTKIQDAEALKKANVEPNSVEEVFFGNVLSAK